MPLILVECQLLEATIFITFNPNLLLIKQKKAMETIFQDEFLKLIPKENDRQIFLTYYNKFESSYIILRGNVYERR